MAVVMVAQEVATAARVVVTVSRNDLPSRS
jgi:hypothetical protein